MDIRKYLFSESGEAVAQGCPGKWGESPSLEVFKNCGDVALRGMVCGMVGAGLQLDWTNLEVLSNINDSAVP